MSTADTVAAVVHPCNCTEKIGTLHNILTNRRILCVHSEGGCDKHHNAARSNLVNRLRKEIIVYCLCDSIRISFVNNRYQGGVESVAHLLELMAAMRINLRQVMLVDEMQ